MAKSHPIPAELKAHPAYSEGYFDGLDALPMQGKQPEEYAVGYQAGVRASEIFESAGFERQDDGGFATSLTIPPQDAQGIAARSDETPTAAQPEGQELGPEGAP